MDLRQLEMFTAVADHSSFTKAAIALDFSQSHVTTQIQKLERAIGARLFERHGRGIALTERGRTLLTYARRLQALAHEAEAAVRSRTEPSGLTIAAHESLTIYRLPELLARLRAASPELNVRITAVDETRIAGATLDGTVDVAFVYAFNHAQPQSNSIVLNEERPVIVCSPRLPIASDGRLQITDIERAEALVTIVPCPARSSFDAMLRRLRVASPRSRELSSVEAIKQCALRELGYAVLPRLSVARELAQGDLRELQPPLELETISTVLVFAPGKTTELNAFIAATRSLYLSA